MKATRAKESAKLLDMDARPAANRTSSGFWLVATPGFLAAFKSWCQPSQPQPHRLRLPTSQKQIQESKGAELQLARIE